MKFSVKTINLKNAINKVERIVTNQVSLPILSNILIKTQKGRLVIIATNLEIAIKTHLGAKIEKEGSITLPTKIISGFLNNLKDEIIEGELIGDNLKLSSQNHKISITGIKSDDFPIIPKEPKEYLIKIGDVKKLNQAISGVLISVAKNETRQELSGVCFNFKEDKIILAATDSYRLTEAVLDLEKDKLRENYNVFIQNNSSIIVPNLTLMELQKMVSEEVSLVVDQNQLFIKTGDALIISRLINGDYPEYQQVIPKEFAITVKLNKDDFLNSLKINSLFLNNNNNEVKIKNLKNEINITSQSEGVGNNVSKIKAEIKGGDFEIILNGRYLMEGISVFKEAEGNEIIIKINNQKTPILIREIDGKGENEKLSYIVMPIIKN